MKPHPTHQYLPGTDPKEAIPESLELLLDGGDEEEPHIVVDVLLPVVLGYGDGGSILQQVIHLGLTKHMTGNLRRAKVTQN